jgi:hypothetical protein
VRRSGADAAAGGSSPAAYRYKFLSLFVGGAELHGRAGEPTVGVVAG